MNIDYTQLLQAVVTLFSALITTVLIPFIRKKLSAEKLSELKSWVSVAVSAAEQLYKGKAGQQKKEFVVAFLLSKGIVFDVDEVNALIESEVYKLTKNGADEL